MWLANTGQCVQVFAGHDGGVSCGLFTLDGKSVCSGGEDGTIRIWAPKTGVCKHNFNNVTGGSHSGGITCLTGSEDGELLASGIVVNIYHLFIFRYNNHNNNNNNKIFICICNLGGFDGEVHLFHVSGKRLVKKFVHSQPTKVSDNSKPTGTEGAPLPIPPGADSDNNNNNNNSNNNNDDEDEWEDEDEDDGDKEMTEAVECVGISKTEIK